MCWLTCSHAGFPFPPQMGVCMTCPGKLVRSVARSPRSRLSREQAARSA